MVDVPPLEPPMDRVEPVGIEVEMQRSYIDYAMSVIVGRALPDVRDGLKPVHRRVLYAMYDGGYRPDRGYVKCARVVGDVMGNYHPHGDTAIYDTLVRLAQPWSMRAPLVDGNGNFGSPGNDPAAAMRYCLAGNTMIGTPDGPVRIADLVPGAAPHSDTDIDLKLLDRHGNPVRATRFFHSGSHPTLRLRTTEGHEVTGTPNHPLLCLAAPAGVPLLLWRLLDEIQLGDHVVIVPDLWMSGAGAGSRAGLLPARDSAPGGLVHSGAGYRYVAVESIAPAGVRPVYSVRVDSDDHAFLSNGFVSHNTESRLAPLAMEMLRDIDQETVDFVPNYDGRSSEPLILPSRIPNLLVNGASGIAVGMATNIPPHNLREVAAGVRWALDHPDATDDELRQALIERIKGPDFPTSALIVGTSAIEEAYRTGRGSVRMRAVVTVEEDRKGRTILVVTELPYQVNPDNLAEKIAELVKDGRITGIADVKDESSARTGQRLVIVLKRDAVAKVVLNNLYKHTQLQDTFGVNMLSLVDGVPRTLRLDQMVRHYVTHQVEVIVRRTRYQLRKAEERAHVLEGLLVALDHLDEVIALIRGAESADVARTQLMGRYELSEIQATAILDMQLRRLAALERQRIVDEYAELQQRIADLQDVLASEPRQRQIVADELAEIVDKHGNERRTRIIPAEGEFSDEDLIEEKPVVVTITRGGYAKRTDAATYRQQKRGGRGIQGAQLKLDDIVDHFFVTTTHHWILFFTNKGRVYRAKAYELPEAGRNARGQHVANLLAFQPDERIAQVIDIKDYSVARYLVLATRKGVVKKTALTEYDSNRSGGLIAVNLREDDELIGVALTSGEDDLLLVSRKAQSIRFHGSDCRPMGRATSGVIGMRLVSADEVLAMEVIRDGADVLVATDGGFAKRTRVDEYPVQNRGGTGVLTARIVEKRGQLIGALIVMPDEEIFAITSAGVVNRQRVDGIRRAQRSTMGVKLINLDSGTTLVAVARNVEDRDEEVPSQ